MPLYEYQCENCGHRFELIRKFSDAPLAECPKCGGAVRKLISSPAFHLKGTGWYATDYARQSEKASSSTDSKSESKIESKATDSKSQEKTGNDASDAKPAKDAATSATKGTASDTSSKSSKADPK